MNDHNLIETLLPQAEGPTLDFKSQVLHLDNDYRKAEFIKDVVCMANTPREGSAYIVYGIDCKPNGSKEIAGISEHPDDANLQQLVRGRVQPTPRFQYRTVTYQEESLGLVEIHSRRGGPFIPKWGYENRLRAGVIYVRCGSSCVEAQAEDIREIAEWMKATEPVEKAEDRTTARRTSLAIRGTSLSLPAFFPSISSVEANLKPVEYLRVLTGIDHPLFLISAYDIHNCTNERDRKRIKALLREAVRNGKAVILDSGRYESFWHKDESWKKREFWQCLESYDYGFAFSFDKRERQVRQTPAQIIVNEIESGVLRDQERTSRGTIIPIVHAPTELIPQVTCSVADRLAPVMIAVPERELGDGIIARAGMIRQIRKALNERDVYYPIHLLGTGNPLSILTYTLCGADSFDGIEWFQTAVNHDTALLYHFQQREFFGDQSPFCSMTDFPYVQATLAHNLLFYRSWMQKIQDAVHSGTIADLAKSYLPTSLVETLVGVCPTPYSK